MRKQPIISRAPLCLLGLLGLTLLAPSVSAQVFDSGPSDPALFDNVINVGPDVSVSEDIGGDGTTTQVNISAGGSVDTLISAESGSEVNVSGGTVGTLFNANSGSEVNVSEGSVGSAFSANSGSEVNVSGGSFSANFGAESGSVVNISGGIVGSSFEANSGSVVNISGGTLGDFFEVSSGSVVNISGGSVGNLFEAVSGSVVNISGGVFGSSFDALPESDVELIGGNFELNGTPFLGSTISLIEDEGNVFSGTLTDGSTFIFSDATSDTLSNVTLTPGVLPPIDVSPVVVATANPIGISGGLSSGQTLTLVSGGEVQGDFEMIDATLNVEGGVLGSEAGAIRTEVNVSGGLVSSGFTAFTGSEVTISGGVVGSSFDAEFGSVVSVSGGTLDTFFVASSGSAVSISGGTFGAGFAALPGSNVEIIGGGFELNGTAFSGSTISLTEGDNFSGSLSDGSAFIFSVSASDILSDVTLTSVAVPPLDLSPLIVSTANPNIPSGLRAGQTLTLLNGGELGDNFEVIDSTLNIEGGEIGGQLGTLRSEVNISGGFVGTGFNALAGSELNISGGEVDGFFVANSGSEVNITGGSVGSFATGGPGSEVNITGGSVGAVFNTFGDLNVSAGSVGGNFHASPGSVVNITGGSFGSGFLTLAESVVNISGGTFGGLLGTGFSINSGAELNLFGSNFAIDGVPLDDSLVMGQAFTIEERDVTLSGVLVDGSPFSFDLMSVDVLFEDFFEPDATVTVTLGPPVTTLLGDVNQDGVVDLSDIAPFIFVLQSGGFQAEADIDLNGVVDFCDVVPFGGIVADSL